MNKRQRKTWDDFFNGTFTSGGIFDEPAKVKFKEPPKQGATLAELITRQIAGAGKPAAAPAGPQMDLDLKRRIEKLDAVINDPRALDSAHKNAKSLKAKLLKKAQEGGT